jgi:hypothetical protein
MLKTGISVIVLYLLLLLSGILVKSPLYSQTVLTAGDVVVIGFKTSAGTQAGNDAVKLLTLVDLECNTKFIVTDNNWRNTSVWYCDDEEFAVEITVVSQVLAGSVIYIDLDAAGGPILVSSGAVTQTSLGSPWGTNFGLNSGGDNVIVLQGTRAAPVFIYALRHNGTFASGGDCSSKNNTALPTGLVLGTSAIQMSSSQDQWHYNCAGTVSSTKAALRTAIGNNANWTNAAGQSWNETACAFTVTDAPWTPVTGSLGVTGAGCGCISGCNLTTLGGPNCSPAVAGNCSAGYQSVSTDIVVPAGCSYTVYATMRIWSSLGCSASGADGSCATCDNLKVDIPGGPKVVKTGGSNATLNDSYTLAGPGTIRVSGRADRADEIVVYRIFSNPCTSCGTFVLPVELIDFTAVSDESVVKLDWVTASESDIDYYTVDRSADGNNWTSILSLSADINGSSLHHYTRIDPNPLQGISFYRLGHTNMNGDYIPVKTVAVNRKDLSDFSVVVANTEAGASLWVHSKNQNQIQMECFDASGRLVFSFNEHVNAGTTQIPLVTHQSGIYFLRVSSNNEYSTHSFISK